MKKRIALIFEQDSDNGPVTVNATDETGRTLSVKTVTSPFSLKLLAIEESPVLTNKFWPNRNAGE